MRQLHALLLSLYVWYTILRVFLCYLVYERTIDVKQEYAIMPEFCKLLGAAPIIARFPGRLL